MERYNAARKGVGLRNEWPYADDIRCWEMFDESMRLLKHDGGLSHAETACGSGSPRCMATRSLGYMFLLAFP